MRRMQPRTTAASRWRLVTALSGGCLLMGIVALVPRALAAGCAQPATNGANPTASDCLFILQAAVGAKLCDPACICDPTGDGNTTASDALTCLKQAVGQSVTLACPCPTTTSSTTTLPPITTTTTPSTTFPPTTTTTLSGGGSIERGRAIYDERCSFCHSAGSHDPVAEFAGDLAGKGDQLVPDLGTIDSSMSGMMLTDQEIADLSAFLDSLL